MRFNNDADTRSADNMIGPRRGPLSVCGIFKLSLLVLAFVLFWAMPAYAVEASDVALPDVSVSGDDAATATVDSETAAVVESEAVIPADEAGAAAGDGEASAPDAETAAAPEPGDGEQEAPAADATTAVSNPSEEPCDCEETAGALEEEVCEDVDKYLELICGEGEWGVFWESKADYDAGLLSMRYRLTNTSTDTAVNNIRVVSATATNGVKVHNDVPMPLGSLQPGEWMYFLLKWEVPKNVRNFVTDISICADCEQLCVDCEPVCEGPDCDPNPVCEGPGCNPPVDEEGDPPVATTQLHASVLPNTGFDLTVPLLLGLGLVMAGTLLPAVRTARQRRR